MKGVSSRTMDNQFIVDPRKCNCGGTCVSVCPLKLIILDEKKFPVRIEGAEKQCIRCGRCVSSCPSQAISLKTPKKAGEEARANHLFVVDAEKCRRDYACAAVCPLRLITVHSKDKLPYPIEQAELQCIQCGHCVAVCPADALSLKILKPGPLSVAADGTLFYGPLTQITMKPQECPAVDAKLLPTAEQVKHLLSARRSIRVYRQEPVDRELLAGLLDSAGYAPTAFNGRPVNWLVISGAKDVDYLSGLVIAWMGLAIKEDPVLAETLNLKRMVAAWEAGEDRICRRAPHVIVAHADGKIAGARTSCTLALGYLELAAFSLGLGACWAGFFTGAAKRYPPLRQALNLPDGHEVFGAMLLGYPEYRYLRVPLRKKASVTWK